MRAIISFAVVSLFSLTAAAVPLQLTHQGRLLDSSDVPLTGTQTVTFTLWDASTATNTLWTDDLSVTFDNGYYSVTLGGSSNPIDENVLDNVEVWMSLTINSEELLPRQRVNSAPYAVMAGTAETVDGYAPADFRMAADDIDWADLHDVPTDEDTLAALPCVDGQVAQLTSSGWACANVGTDTLAGLPCVDGQVAQLTSSGWACANVGTDTLAGLSCSTNDVAILTGSGWDCVALPDFTGWDTDQSNDLVTSTMFAGDVAGPYDALGISAGAVSEANLDFSTATQTELDAVAASIPAPITSVDGLTGGALAGNLSASGAAIEGPTNLHLAVGIHGNQDNDSFSVCTDSNRDGDLDTVGLIVTNVGNVGIGTAGPLATLDVRGDVVASGNVGVGTTNPQSTLHVASASPEIKIDATGAGDYDYGLHWVSNALAFAYDSNGDGAWETPAPMALAGPNTTFDAGTLYVDGTNDRVGVGTTTPQVDLDVQGDTTLAGSKWFTGPTTIGANGTPFFEVRELTGTLDAEGNVFISNPSGWSAAQTAILSCRYLNSFDNWTYAGNSSGGGFHCWQDVPAGQIKLVGGGAARTYRVILMFLTM